ncbi:peroxidase-like [Acyrthosiphon pisum]|uniref:Peroxidase n=1 Tax=Acyrthosiphon pisum TaxID=7029 RepID=A0A8R2NJU6_ACYPI|nr:peroxidase-like [Acyrthosiphon pisum]|eukprot:XP_008179477.1 PREDICTED: peroxidase-like [Acyrthosiphon pisum]
MKRTSTSIIIIRLLICTVIFVPPCCTENWYLELDISDVNQEIQKVVEIIENRYRSEDIILSNISRLIIGSPVYGQMIDSMPSKEGHSGSRNAEIIYEVTRSLKNTYCLSYGLSDIQCAKDLTKVNLTGTTLGEMCMAEYHNNNYSCIGKDFDYRSLDGSCNNLKRKYLGKANTPYKRLLFPVYKDGVYEMPNINDEMLPNPRLVSTNLVKDEDSPDQTKTMMMAYWSIFIGHDLSHTTVSTIGKENRFVNCCDKDKSIQYSLNKNIRSCKPIFIPDEDRFFKPDPFDYMNCMNYVRSRPAVRSDCTFGPMEQMNQATHYLDASMIYGTTEQQTLSLRQMSLGKLLVQKKRFIIPSWDIMPLETTDTNVCQNGPGTCFRAGDIRANALPQLNAVHTLWVREHNRVAGELYKEKIFLTDEELFQEAKKIVTACIQHITYNEWLPALLGVNYTKENGLGLGQRTTYDETADPTVSNSFATAILPFANSMISDSIRITDTYLYPPGQPTLKEHYNKPLILGSLVTHVINDMLIGLTMQATQKVDMLFTQSITNYLYSIDPNDSFGMDILSLDIQRSRDHGIPSYTQFRKYCGLTDIENVQDLSEIMVEGSADKLLKLYKTWNDIDLLVGALLEKHVDDAMVGPTMRCIIKEQFVRTRIADRFFYDVPGVFSDYQLENIRKVTLARVLCDNADIELMTLEVFSRPAVYDHSVHGCISTLIPNMKFIGWFDKLEDNFFGIK